MLHERALEIENGYPRLFVVRQEQLVADDLHVGRRDDNALPDDALEYAVQVVDLEAAVGAITDDELRIVAPPVDDDSVWTVDAAGISSPVSVWM
jgi:hypothetical protein